MRVQMGRPALDGVKGGEVDPARGAFVERYLRQGLEAGVELKSFSGATGATETSIACPGGAWYDPPPIPATRPLAS